ncbi:MAG TPA: zinc ribbon domain-containing protein [Terriglobales bacterium]|nr:zinc ribbon domain-containing protein [Terriglobales bacterium]
MDHVCQQCGAEVEQGVPFCRKCNAPQIRVSTPASEVEGEPEAASQEGPTASAPRLGVPISDEKIDWRFARSRSAIAAAAMVLLMLVPLLSKLFILWMPLCGGLPVFLYRRVRPGGRLSAGAGARMGAMAGLIAFTVLLIIMAAGFAIEHYVLHQSDQLVAQVRNQVQQAVNANSDPQVKQLESALLSPNGLAMIVVFSMMFLFAMFLLLCGIGGALSAVLLGRPNKS